MEKSKPNILVILTDDQRYDTINALGNKDIYTPNMDYLVENGLSFVNAHIMGGSHPAICMPSRAMLNTGRTIFGVERCGYDIPAEHTTLGETFAKNGYETIGIGKWHNGHSAYARSFTDGDEILFAGMEDHWNAPLCHFNPEGKYPPMSPLKTQLHLRRDKETVYRSYDHIYEGRHSSEIFADAAVRLIHKHSDSAKPFCMYMATMAPHDPRTMPQRFLDMYNPDTIPLPENFMPEHPFDKGDMMLRDEYLAPLPRTPGSVRKEIALYYAMISHLDAQIGNVINALRETGQLDNTIIVFAGDNGLAIGSHGLMGKQNMYDHSIRVPLVMSGPGIPRGIKTDSFCYLSDVFPTLCEMTGAAIPASVQQRSLLPIIKDPKAEVYDAMFYMYTRYSRMVKNKNHKLIEYLVDGKRTTQLFDLVIDQWEMNNLYGDPAYAPIVKKLRQKLVEVQKELKDPMVGMFGDYEAPAPAAAPLPSGKKMKALVCHGVDDYSLDDAPVPQTGEGDILLKVEAAGICLEDVKAYHRISRYWGMGDIAAFVIPPVIPCREVTGTIAESKMPGFEAGQRVTVEPIMPCGKCRYCTGGQPALCVNQGMFGYHAGLDGAAAQYMRLPKGARVHPIMDLPLEKAAYVHVYADAMHCIERAGVKQGDIVMLAGAGQHGAAMIPLIKQRRPAKLIVFDNNPGRLERAKSLGADIALDPRKLTLNSDPRMWVPPEEINVARYLEGRGCDVFINTSGQAGYIGPAFDYLCQNGVFVEFSIFDGFANIDWTEISTRKELTILGVHCGMGNPGKAAGLLRDNALPVFGIKSYPLAQWKEAFDENDSHDFKTLLIPG